MIYDDQKILTQIIILLLLNLVILNDQMATLNDHFVEMERLNELKSVKYDLNENVLHDL